MRDDTLDFYRAPGPMTILPKHAGLDPLPDDLDGLRAAVQGVLLHRDWAPSYGVEGAAIRIDEQQLRSTAEVLDRVFELSSEPITVPRPPVDRVLCICRHFTLIHTAFLRSKGIPARARCGFSNYFDPSKWYDHWITERWDGRRWVRDDPQIDKLQATTVKLDFDPYDQPAGKFMTGSEAWVAARAGEVDPMLFGIFDMWGLGFIGGNVVNDFACLNKVELLPWDGWAGLTAPNQPVADDSAAFLDDLAKLVNTDDVEAIRQRYETDDRLRVPPVITSFVDGQLREVRLEL